MGFGVKPRSPRLRLCGRPTEKTAGSPARDDRMFVAGWALRRLCLRRAGALHGSEIQVEQGLLFVALVFVLLARRKISLRTFTSKASPLASAKTSFLPSFNALISSSMRSTRSIIEQMRSPGIPAVFVMPAPSFKRACGIATKVTEKLFEPTENSPDAKPHAAARAGVDQSAAITNMYDRLALMGWIATNAPSGLGRRSLSVSREAVPNLNQCIRVGTDCGGAEFCRAQ